MKTWKGKTIIEFLKLVIEMIAYETEQIEN